MIYEIFGHDNQVVALTYSVSRWIIEADKGDSDATLSIDEV
jgi:hypothetical protein